MDNRPILIFDSGIGGFSILKHLIHCGVPLIYFADQGNFPYGDKSPAWVEARLSELAPTFAHYRPRGVVLACNTGTVVAIKALRKLLTCPVYGVEPVTKMLSHHHTPVIWGTKITTNSETAASLKHQHGPHVVYYTPLGLASAIEHDDQPGIMASLQRAKVDCGSPDALGLSCTHYPLISAQIAEFFPQASLYDPAQAVAKHVLNDLRLSLNSQVDSVVEYVSTGDVLRLKQLATKYL